MNGTHKTSYRYALIAAAAAGGMGGWKVEGAAGDLSVPQRPRRAKWLRRLSGFVSDSWITTEVESEILADRRH
jgi:hypothetical protein